MSEPSILYEAREGVATITLNRPEVLNAFTPQMLDLLHETLHRAADEGQRAVLLTGAGRGFSAGQDLTSIQDDYRMAAPTSFRCSANIFTRCCAGFARSNCRLSLP